MEGSEDLLLRGGEFDEGAGSGRAAGHRLVHHDVLAGLERCGGEFDMGVVGRAHDDQVDGEVSEGLCRGGDDAGVRICGRGGGGALGVADDDGGEFESRHGMDKGAVKDPAGEAVAEDRGADGSAGHRNYRRQGRAFT